MEKIYSKIEPDLLLHIIVSFQDFNTPFLEITETKNFLQSIAQRVNEGHEVAPHKHNLIDTHYIRKQQQEAWVVLSGMIKCTLYDIDDTIIHSFILTEKGVLYTLGGAHALLVLEDHTIILEFKCGPYEGQANDKTFLNK
jgi:cupin fold WbuC family metalloprotein